MRLQGANSGEFPPLEFATPDGLLAVGGDLSAERLIEAYSQGIFPWYNPGQPILWWSPDPRAVLFPAEFKASRSLRKSLRRGRFRFTMDSAFAEVVEGCAAPRGDDTRESWITAEMKRAYIRLHDLRIAHSVEVWEHDRLVGGLYGVAMGRIFFGESMFSRVPDASKCALAALAGKLIDMDYRLIDCQIESDHLTSLGARNIPRRTFAATLRAGLEETSACEAWCFRDQNLERYR
jgi:leucyl/phenylalanyl-tRNA--protein transferase